MRRPPLWHSSFGHLPSGPQFCAQTWHAPGPGWLTWLLAQARQAAAGPDRKRAQAWQSGNAVAAASSIMAPLTLAGTTDNPARTAAQAAELDCAHDS